jgi:hypothetical protein
MLEFAALTGMTLRPEEIRDLMQTMHLPRLAQALPEAAKRGDGERD